MSNPPSSNHTPNPNANPAPFHMPPSSQSSRFSQHTNQPRPPQANHVPPHPSQGPPPTAPFNPNYQPVYLPGPGGRQYYAGFTFDSGARRPDGSGLDEDFMPGGRFGPPRGWRGGMRGMGGVGTTAFWSRSGGSRAGRYSISGTSRGGGSRASSSSSMQPQASLGHGHRASHSPLTPRGPTSVSSNRPEDSGSVDPWVLERMARDLSGGYVSGRR